MTRQEEYRRKATSSGSVSRSGGRTTKRQEHLVSGSMALKPRRATFGAPDRQDDSTNQRASLRAAPPAPVRAPRMPFVILVLSIVIVGVVGILVLNIRINENAFELDRLQQDQKSLDINQGTLEKEIAEREAPGALAGQAADLGMKPPTEPPKVIVLPDDRKVDVPQPAVGR